MRREEYLNGPRSEIQLAIARLRLGGHNFPVETGRCAKIAFVQRKYDRGSLNNVGTILHCFQFTGNKEWLEHRGMQVNNEKRLVKIMKNPSMAAKLGIRDLLGSIGVRVERGDKAFA